MSTKNIRGAPSRAEVMAAVRKSGYLMEQEVASGLESLGFHVQTNWAYQDVDEGKSREMDVRAIKRIAQNEEFRLSAFIEIIVECKQNNSNPLVLIVRDKNELDTTRAPGEYLFPVANYEMQKQIESSRSVSRMLSPYFHLEFDKVHYEFAQTKKAVQFCRIERFKKGWRATHSGLYDGLFYPIAKAVEARKLELKPQRRPRSGEWRYFWFIMPVIVLSGEIYSIDSMQSSPVVENMDFMTFKRQLSSQNLKGIYSVDFVR